MRISRIVCYEVVVPAKAGTIASAEVDKPLHKLAVGATDGWSIQFDQLSKVILKLELEHGIAGWGELYRGHQWSMIEEMVDRLLGEDINSLSLQKLPMAFCREYDGFECAVWDAFARLHELRIVDLLGGPVRDRIRVGAWSSHRTAEELENLVVGFHQQGFDCVKFKCDLEDDVEAWCRIISEQCPGLQVILDPNERWAYPYEVRKRLDQLRPLGNILCLEDPIPRWKLEDYADLRQFSDIPIVLHVSLPYVAHGQRTKEVIQALNYGAVDGFNFNGGLANFQLMSHIAAAAELPCWHGSEIDLGISEARYLHSAAAAAACIWPSDIFGRLIREHDLLEQPLKIDPPYAQLPQGPGLGVTPDPEALKKYSIDQREFEAK